MLDEKQRFNQIVELGREIAQVKDVDLLLEKILAVARRFVNADAGSIYIRENDRLKFSHTQNDALQEKLPPGQKLIYSIFSIPINHESIAGYVAGTGEMLNIPDVYHLPDTVPYSFNKEYDEVSRYRSQSILTFPLKTSRGEVIGVLQLINAMDSNGTVLSFAKEDEPLIMYFAGTAAIALERAQMTRAIILRMIRMAELRDPKETGPHVNRVASYAIEIYESWAVHRGVSREEIERNRDILKMAAMLHDVGKVAISDMILKKPGKLDPAEFEVMKEHVYRGARLFDDACSDLDEAASIVALNHHERWDGSGYPGHVDSDGHLLSGYESEFDRARGKRGEEIHPFGRVVAIADVYDALCSRRVYKEPWDESMVLETLRKESGRHFDPEMIEAFFRSLDVIRSIAQRYPDKH